MPEISSTLILIALLAIVFLLWRLLTRGFPRLGSMVHQPTEPAAPPAPPVVAQIAAAIQAPPTPTPVVVPPPSPVQPVIVPPNADPGTYQTLERRLHEVEALLGRLASQQAAPPQAAVPINLQPAAPPAKLQVCSSAVYQLIDSGIPTREVARRLSVSRTEVELLLELRRIQSAIGQTE